MKGTILLFLSMLSIAQLCSGQSNYATSALTSPSDNNSFLASFGVSKTNEKVDVDLFTGTARVNIPICELQSNQLKVPISLSYVSGRGVKVQDVANQVGLGWQLNAGGYVSRIVRGLPDENVNGYLGTSGDGHNVKATVTGTTLYNSIPILDQEPDLFYVSTPYISFHFTYDDNGNVIIPNNNGYQVISNLYNYPGTGNTYFEVIDDQGNQFYFGSSAASQDDVTTYTTITTHNGNTITTAYTFPITWYLDKIVTYNSQDQINLTYISGANYSVATYTGLSVNFYSFNPAHYTAFWNGGTTPLTNYTSPKYVSTITGPQGEVDFTYAFDRQDFSAVGRLTNIVLKAYSPLTGANSTTLKTFNLNYSYFGSTSDVNSLRLRLDNISITRPAPATAGPLLLNSFDYNLATALPDRNSPEFDYWGYYNDNSPTVAADTWNLLPDGTNRAPYLPSASAGVLIGVHNVTGEVTQLQYELNTYSNNGVNTAVGGLRTHAITWTYANNPNPVTKQYTYNDVSGHSTGMFYGYSSTGNHMYSILSVVNANYDVSFASSVSIAGVTFPCWAVQTDGVTPYNTYDLDGNFIGYSAVTEVSPDGGYAISQFTNFNTFQDIYSITPINFTGNFWGSPTTLTSEGEGNAPVLQETIPGYVYSYDYSYKRGLLLDRTVYAAGGNKVSEMTNTYTSLNASPTVTSYGYRTVGWGAYTNSYEYYSTHIENYRLTQTVKKDFDQANTANYVQRTFAFTYCPNLRSISTITNTDSKGLTRTETYYHADDTNIPLLTTGEQSAVTTMVQGNRTNILIHETDTRNGVIHQVHNSYGLIPMSLSSNHVYLTTVSGYTGSTLVKQQVYQFDPNTSNLLSLYVTGSKPISYQYLYGSSLMCVEAVNANRSIVNSIQPQTTAGYVSITGNSSATATFTTSVAGTIIVAMPPSSYLGQSGGATCYFRYNLSGPSAGSGTLCNSSVSGYTCTGGNSTTYSGMPAGTYTLSVSPISNTATASVPVTYNYTGTGLVTTTTSEFFFEGFEQLGNVTTSAHTGHGSYSGSYTVYYTPPNSRSYVIQWWNYANGVWNFNEQPYTGTTTLSGQIDDVRVFPTDAQLTTFSFDPQLGIIGVTDSSGRSTSFQYDPLGRVNLVLDNDQNILKKFDYEYQALIAPVGNTPQSGTYTRNNCATGGTPLTMTYTVPANTYTSVISQADANQQAINDVNANGQNYVNANGTCTFYNVATSGTYTRNNCPTGGAGNPSTYTVAAGAYSSTVSQAAANTLAQNDVNANGQNYANANAACVFFNVVTTGTYSRNNCACLYNGSSVIYTVFASEYQSTVSQAAANALAQNDVNANGQTYANAHGTCTTSCASPQNKVISCACKAGVYGQVSELYNGGKCVISYGYTYPDGTYTVTSTSSTTGPCN